MEPLGDHVDEMGVGLTFDQAEAVLSGQVPTGASPVTSDAAAVVAELRRSLCVEPSDAVADRHLAAMLAARPVAPAPVISLPVMARPSLRTRALRWAAAAGIAGGVTLTGGLASAGSLPSPLQDGLANLGGWVGLELPRSADPTEAPATDTTGDAPEGTHGDTVTDAVDSTEATPYDGREFGDRIADAADTSDQGETTPAETAPGSTPAGEKAEADDLPDEGKTPPSTIPEEGQQDGQESEHRTSWRAQGDDGTRS